MKIKRSPTEIKRVTRPFEVKSLKEDGTFSGYGSVFGVIDSYNDIMQAGCFVKSLAQQKVSGSMPAMLWQHNSDEPCGVYTSMDEDAYGLKVDGSLCLDTQRGKEAYALLKMGAIKGLSIGYCTNAYAYDKESDIMTLTDVDLWEVSLVTFPANSEAQVSSVKSAELIEHLTDLKSAEAFLRDSCKLSRSEATAFIARMKGLAQRDSAADEEASQIIAALKRRSELIKS